MSIINKGLEFVRPYKNIKEMFQAFSEGDFAGGIKNYVESIPGVIGAARVVVQGAPKVFTPAISKTVQIAVSKAANWYTAPFKTALKIGVEKPFVKATAPIGGTVAGLKSLGVLGAVAGIDHVVGRATKSRYISLFDAIATGISGKPSKEVQQRIDHYKSGQSSLTSSGLMSIGGNPLNMLLLKLLRPSLFK